MTIKCGMPRGLLVVAFALALTLPAGASAGTSGATGSTLTRASSLESLVLAEINAVRAAKGVHPLGRSAAL